MDYVSTMLWEIPDKLQRCNLQILALFFLDLPGFFLDLPVELVLFLDNKRSRSPTLIFEKANVQLFVLTKNNCPIFLKKATLYIYIFAQGKATLYFHSYAKSLKVVLIFEKHVVTLKFNLI